MIPLTAKSASIYFCQVFLRPMFTEPWLTSKVFLCESKVRAVLEICSVLADPRRQTGAVPERAKSHRAPTVLEMLIFCVFKKKTCRFGDLQRIGGSPVPNRGGPRRGQIPPCRRGTQKASESKANRRFFESGFWHRPKTDPKKLPKRGAPASNVIK